MGIQLREFVKRSMSKWLGKILQTKWAKQESTSTNIESQTFLFSVTTLPSPTNFSSSHITHFPHDYCFCYIKEKKIRGIVKGIKLLWILKLTHSKRENKKYTAFKSSSFPNIVAYNS